MLGFSERRQENGGLRGTRRMETEKGMLAFRERRQEQGERKPEAAGV